MSPKKISPARTVAADYDGQRLDNYLNRELKGAPRPLIHRLIRTGQVRINGRRAAAASKLRTGDLLRIPDNILLSPPKSAAPPAQLPVLYEDREFLAINKPAGLAVHGGSGEAHGVVERLRAARQNDRFLELAHRLDKHTSGVLLLAKKSSALRAIHTEWCARRVQKIYHALVFGKWQKRAATIDLPLKRAARGIGGMVAGDGRPALTRTSPLKQFAAAALVRADIATGRTHQLRVHLAAVGLPIVGDDKYGDFTANRQFAAAVQSGKFANQDFVNRKSVDKNFADTFRAAKQSGKSAARDFVNRESANQNFAGRQSQDFAGRQSRDFVGQQSRNFVGRQSWRPRMLLHAARLRFRHPNGEMLDIRAPQPPDFTAAQKFFS